jgi:beta-aspartyl-dipeptidase (metallo-type)
MTSNVARLLRLPGKGRLAAGADLVCLHAHHGVKHVMARGRWMVQHGTPLRTGLFESPSSPD